MQIFTEYNHITSYTTLINAELTSFVSNNQDIKYCSDKGKYRLFQNKDEPKLCVN